MTWFEYTEQCTRLGYAPGMTPEQFDKMNADDKKNLDGIRQKKGDKPKAPTMEMYDEEE